MTLPGGVTDCSGTGLDDRPSQWNEQITTGQSSILFDQANAYQYGDTGNSGPSPFETSMAFQPEMSPGSNATPTSPATTVPISADSTDHRFFKISERAGENTKRLPAPQSIIRSGATLGDPSFVEPLTESSTVRKDDLSSSCEMHFLD
ncbi:hypothetical protein V866_005521 [Kwoniella sp. B9012]